MNISSISGNSYSRNDLTYYAHYSFFNLYKEVKENFTDEQLPDPYISNILPLQLEFTFNVSWSCMIKSMHLLGKSKGYEERGRDSLTHVASNLIFNITGHTSSPSAIDLKTQKFLGKLYTRSKILIQMNCKLFSLDRS
jgi:hypothetical protein